VSARHNGKIKDTLAMALVVEESLPLGPSASACEQSRVDDR
jgi:hypothetical protein